MDTSRQARIARQPTLRAPARDLTAPTAPEACAASAEQDAAARALEEAAESYQRKRAAGIFDVFLCHNGADKPAVKAIAQQLSARHILPWLDEWELPPGKPWQPLLEKQIGSIRTAAVFVGPNGIGPWQEQELYGLLGELVSRNIPVIPVLLRDAPQRPGLPLFLRGVTWVDFRKPEPNPLEHLIWGIRGERPGTLP